MRSHHPVPAPPTRTPPVKDPSEQELQPATILTTQSTTSTVDVLRKAVQTPSGEPSDLPNQVPDSPVPSQSLVQTLHTVDELRATSQATAGVSDGSLSPPQLALTWQSDPDIRHCTTNGMFGTGSPSQWYWNRQR